MNSRSQYSKSFWS